MFPTGTRTTSVGSDVASNEQKLSATVWGWGSSEASGTAALCQLPRAKLGCKVGAAGPDSFLQRGGGLGFVWVSQSGGQAHPWTLVLRERASLLLCPGQDGVGFMCRQGDQAVTIKSHQCLGCLLG